jgi:hypothetical protein
MIDDPKLEANLCQQLQGPDASRLAVIPGTSADQLSEAITRGKLRIHGSPL